MKSVNGPNLHACKAVGALVVPIDPIFACSFFIIFEDGKHWNAFVHDYLTLPKLKNIFKKVKPRITFFGSKDLSFSVTWP